MNKAKKVYEYTIYRRRSTRGNVWYQAWDGPHLRMANARRVKARFYPGAEYIIGRLCVDIIGGRGKHYWRRDA